jgi:hypothetical protein
MSAAAATQSLGDVKIAKKASLLVPVVSLEGGSDDPVVVVQHLGVRVLS